jgi:hypothetical protein
MAMTRARLAALITMAGAVMCSCGIERPGYADGDNVLIIQAIDTSGSTGVDSAIVTGASIELSSSTCVFKGTFTTDELGRVVIEHLPSGDYYIQASKRAEVQYGILTAQKQLTLENEAEREDTLLMSFASLSPVVINEVYYCGCSASTFYYYDQFIELYNSTDDTLYLDGYVAVRGTQIDDLIGFDKETAPIALGFYVYKFPGIRGETRQCPIAPQGYLVLAGDGINHHNYGALCVDLSHADWEFLNAAKNDYDAPGVRNLTPVSTEGNDFTMNLIHNAVWLATGEEYVFKEYSYMSSSGGIQTTICAEIPLNGIIDAVEYSANAGSPRYMTLRLDGGFAGVGITRYSGQSIERKMPGQDTNNSAFDFVNLPSPTPGWSHAQ